MLLIRVLWILIIHLQISLEETYNVAVIEFAINTNYSQPAKDILEENIRNYLSLIENLTQNQSQALDLIVFPESTLTPYVSISDTAAQLPSSSDVVLCTSTDNKFIFLKNLSCSAIRHKTTIVINLTEKEVCDVGENGCPESKELFYNTNIAIGANGTIVARYRKWNLFGEYGKSKPTTLDLPVITIKNATFGMMTCFDIQFGTPGFNLTKDKGIQNIIFPLNWISELPYLTALQVEQMWAQEFNVVLLASGSNRPESGAGGSGIFFGNQGPLESDILSESGTKVMIQSVPTDIQQKLNISHEDNNTVETIDNLAESMDNFFMLVDPSIKDHKSMVLNASGGVTNAEVCHGEEDNILCCEFNISISINNNTNNSIGRMYTYHLVAYNGVRTYSGLYYGGVETCGVIACLNDSVASCGQRFHNYSDISWPLTFNSISIKGNFSQSDQRVQFPTTLLSSIRPLAIQDYFWKKEEVNSTVIRAITSQKPQSRLLTFGIFGRDFERDWDPIRNNTTNDCAENINFSFVFILLIFLCCYV